VIGTLRTLGPGTAPLTNHLTYLAQMNELLFDPPSVEGYKAGDTWFNSTTMLARTNFASVLAANRRNDLADTVVAALGTAPTPTAIVEFIQHPMGNLRPDPTVRADQIQYMTTFPSGSWIGSTAQLRTKVPGLVHLISGTPDYAFI
jgi:hypothetical protein